MDKSKKFLITATLAASLVACGGGSSVTTVTRVVLPMAQVTANAGETAYLSAVGSIAGGTYSWIQVTPDTFQTNVPTGQQVTIKNANTQNPSIVLPSNIATTGTVQLAMQVTFTAPDGTQDKQVVKMTVSPQAAQTPQQAATANVLATPLLVVTTTATSSAVTAATTVPLSFTLSPNATLVSGDKTNLSVSASGGNGNYSYSWRQVSGTSATVTGENTNVLSVTAPAVKADENLRFEVTVSDKTSSKTGIVNVTAKVSAVQLPPSNTAVKIEVAPKSQMTSAQTIPVKATDTTITNIDLQQIEGAAGPAPLRISSTEYTFTAPAITSAKEYIKLMLTITYQNGTKKTVILPIEVVGNSLIGGAVPTQPPQAVQPTTTVVPLAIDAVGVAVDEGKVGTITAQGIGGTGQYTYTWIYKTSEVADPADRKCTGNTCTFTAPQVTGNKELKLGLTVSDGKETSSQDVSALIFDTSTVLSVEIKDITVTSGQVVGLSFGAPSGGVPPYNYLVGQLSGTTVKLSSSDSANPSFTAPTLQAGAPDTILTFELTVLDSIGTNVSVRQKVTVKP